MPHSARSSQESRNAWKSYVLRFRHKAKSTGSDDEYIAKCLSYARNLWNQGVPVIFDADHLCKLVGYNPKYLLGASNSPRHFYRSFTVPKKSGGRRRIDEPLPSLKEIQHWILREILDKISPSVFAKAFRADTSIKDNAKFHRAQQIVLMLDIKDFFHSIKFSRIYGVYHQIGYTKPVAVALSNLSLLNGALPQGAPTSPALSNLVCRRLDARIAGYCLKRGLRYTRYADDIAISGNFKAIELINFVSSVATEDGFILNGEKTRVLEHCQRQQITGVVVNDILRAPRDVRDELRQHVYYIEKFGLASHMDRCGLYKANFPMHLGGLAAHVLSIDPLDRDALAARRLVKRLLQED